MHIKGVLMSDSNNELLQIQRLQFQDRLTAETRLKCYLHLLGMVDIQGLQLNVKPESLNSMNGLANFDDGSQLFFKTHIEENEKISEYYNSALLAEACYPVVLPKRVRTTPGEQIAFYEVVSFPTLFDLTHEEENKPGGSNLALDLVLAQEALDKKLFKIYQRTLLGSEEFPKERSPIHQLFYERLDINGRLGLFYLGKELSLERGAIPIQDLFAFHWIINGVEYKETIADLINQAGKLLNPEILQPTIIGHGDAHNGNVFWDEGARELKYFDAAFAGRHSTILDLTKPLFHNVFAKWMYFPEEVSRDLELSYSISDKTIEIRHNFIPSSIRVRYLNSKIQNLLQPLLRELALQNQLPVDWKATLKSALFCCPLLTVNLAAEYNGTGKLAERYSENIKLLGFAMALEVGATRVHGTNPIRELCSLFENLK